MTKAVFFDVGNTLVRACPSVAETFARVAAERGHALTVRDVEPHMPALDAYYEAEYLRDGDFWCSHEGSVAIWLEQYRYLCHLIGIAHDAEGMARAVHETYRHAAGWEVFPDVEGCLRTLKRQGRTLGVVSNWDAELEGLLRACCRTSTWWCPRRPWGTASPTRSSSTSPARRWVSRSATRCMWATAPMRTAKGRRGPASGPSSSIGATWRTAVPTSASSR